MRFMRVIPLLVGGCLTMAQTCSAQAGEGRPSPAEMATEFLRSYRQGKALSLTRPEYVVVANEIATNVASKSLTEMQETFGREEGAAFHSLLHRPPERSIPASVLRDVLLSAHDAGRPLTLSSAESMTLVRDLATATQMTRDGLRKELGETDGVALHELISNALAGLAETRTAYDERNLKVNNTEFIEGLRLLRDSKPCGTGPSVSN